MAQFLITILALLIGLSSIFVVNASPVETKPMVEWEEFSNAITSNVDRNNVKFPPPSRKQYEGFIKGLPHGGPITTKKEAAMALAQFIHESDGLQSKQEWACVKPVYTGCPGKYENPKLDKPGKDYFGRGYTQLTWSDNYQRASLDLYKDERLRNEPEQVGKDEDVAWAVTFWYWKKKVHHREKVQQGLFGDSTFAINEGECKSKKKHFVKNRKARFTIYKNVLKAFNIRDKPNEEGCYRVSACVEPERRSILSTILSVITCNYDYMVAHTGQLDDDDSSSS